MNEIINIIKLRDLIHVNKIYSLIHVNKKTLKLLIILSNILKEIINKSTYIFLYIMVLLKYEQVTALNLFIILSIVGFIINTHMFDANELKKYLFGYLKSKGEVLVKYYYLKTNCQIISMIFAIILFVNLCLLPEIYILYLILFILNGKTLANSIFLFFFKRKKYLYQEDNPPIFIYLIVIALGLTFILSIIVKVNLINLIHIVNLIGIFSHIYLISYKNYDLIVRKNNEYLADYSQIKEYNIKYKEVSEEKNINRYIVKIFRKRHIKYFIIYGIKYVLLLLFIIIFSNKSTYMSKKAFYIIGLIYFFSPTEKIIDLYYFRCDRYIKESINISGLKKERQRELIIMNIIIFLPLLCMFPKYILFTILIIYLLNTLYINIYSYLKIYNENNNMKKWWYYLSKIILSIIFIFI